MTPPSSSPILSLTISRMMVTLSQSVSTMDTTNTLSKELLLALYSIFGSLLWPALDLVDRMAVSLVRVEEGGREVVTVRGSGGLNYNLIRGSHYCPCPSYQ